MKREEILKEIRRLAKGRVNDAVRLAYLSESELEEIGRLELSAVTEFRRSSNGTVELKFVDRLSALKWLSEQAEDPKGERLYEALERGTEVGKDRGTVPEQPSGGWDGHCSGRQEDGGEGPPHPSPPSAAPPSP